MKTPVLLTTISLVASALGLLGQLVIAWRFGASEQVDSYFTVVSLPLFVGGVVNAAISYKIIPTLIRRGFSDEGVLLSWILLAAGTLALVGGAISSKILPRYPHGEALVANAGIEISWIAWSTMAAGLVSAVLSAAAHLRGRYLLPAFAMWLPPAGLVGAWFLAFERLKLFAIALLAGQLLAVAVLAAVLIARDGLRLHLGSPRIFISEFAGAGFVLLSVLSFTAFGAIDAIVAAPLGEGGVTMLAYAQRITVAAGALAVNGLGTVAFPRFARSFAAAQHVEFSADIIRTMRSVALMVVLFVVLFSVWREHILSLLFYFGELGSSNAMRDFASIIPGYLIGGVVMSCTTIMFRGLYAANLVRPAALLSVLGVASYAILSASLVNAGYGLASFVVAYGACWTITLAGAFFVLRRQLGNGWQARCLEGWFGMTVAVASVAAGALFTRGIILPSAASDQPLVTIAMLGACTAVICMAYICILCFLGIKEALPLVSVRQRLMGKLFGSRASAP